MKYTFILVLLLTISQCLSAQSFGVKFQSNNQQLIENAIAESYVLVQQKYLLEDTVSKQQFGRNGASYFGSVQALAIRTNKGLVMWQECLTPWSVDENFTPYQGQYAPLICESLIQLKDNKEIKEEKQSSLITIDNSIAYSNNLYGYVGASDWFNEGLHWDTSQGEKDGWVIWFTSATSTLHIDSIQLLALKKPVTVDSDTTMIQVDKPVGKNILGGIYVTPQFSGLGRIDFSLSGVVIPQDDAYQLIFPFHAVETSVELVDVQSVQPIVETADSIVLPAKEEVQIKEVPKSKRTHNKKHK